MNDTDTDTDTEMQLYVCGIQTAVACWTAYARTITGGTVHPMPGVDVAVFTRGPEREVFNNAVLGHGLSPTRRQEAVDAMQSTYAAAGVTAYAAWVHESDDAMLADLKERGFTHQETTWAMGRTLDGASPAEDLRVGPADWAEYLRVLELPPGLLEDADPHDFDVVVGRIQGEPLATGMAFHHDTDCGIYNVGTLERSRRQGLGSAVVAALLAGGVEGGCLTSTLQATEMARGVYAGLGFRDVGRILEHGPPAVEQDPSAG